MARATDITAHELHEDTSAALRRAESGEHLRVLVDRQPVAQLVPIEDSGAWVDAEVMEARIRGAQADEGLRQDLDRLQPDTIADLGDVQFSIRRSSSPAREAVHLGDFRADARWLCPWLQWPNSRWACSQPETRACALGV